MGWEKTVSVVADVTITGQPPFLRIPNKDRKMMRNTTSPFKFMPVFEQI